MYAKPKHLGGTHCLPQMTYTPFRGKNLEGHSAKYVDAWNVSDIDLSAGSLAGTKPLVHGAFI